MEKCETCGMVYSAMHYESHDQMWAGEAPTVPHTHVCPEPFPPDVAEAVASFHRASGLPMHPADYARCVLALA